MFTSFTLLPRKYQGHDDKSISIISTPNVSMLELWQIRYPPSTQMIIGHQMEHQPSSRLIRASLYIEAQGTASSDESVVLELTTCSLGSRALATKIGNCGMCMRQHPIMK